MTKPVRITLWVGGGLAVLVAGAAGVGAALPPTVHEEGKIFIAKPPEEVWDLLADRTKLPTWSPDFSQVTTLGNNRWRAKGPTGIEFTFVDTVMNKPGKMTARILDGNKQFTGTWDVEIAPAAGGSEVTSQSTTEVHNPFFRLMAHSGMPQANQDQVALDELKHKLGS